MIFHGMFVGILRSVLCVFRWRTWFFHGVFATLSQTVSSRRGRFIVPAYTYTPTKLGANTPPGVGADSSRPYPDIIKYTFSHYQICTFTSSHTHIHIINYVFLHHQIHISISPNTHFRSPFRGCIRIRGHDKSAPTAADGLR